MQSRNHDHAEFAHSDQCSPITLQTCSPSTSEISFSLPRGASIYNPFVIPSTPATPLTEEAKDILPHNFFNCQRYSSILSAATLPSNKTPAKQFGSGFSKDFDFISPVDVRSSLIASNSSPYSESPSYGRARHKEFQSSLAPAPGPKLPKGGSTTNPFQISTSPNYYSATDDGYNFLDSASDLSKRKAPALPRRKIMAREREPPRAPLSPTKSNQQVNNNATVPSVEGGKDLLMMAPSGPPSDDTSPQPLFGRPTQLGSTHQPSIRPKQSSGTKPESNLFHRPTTNRNPLYHLQSLAKDRIPPPDEIQPPFSGHNRGVPIQQPTNPTYSIQPAPQRQFMSQPYEDPYRGSSFASQKVINLTGSNTSVNHTHDIFVPQINEFEPGIFIDSSKAHENIKDLLEGAFEDEEDKPRTRLRKKKLGDAAADLADKLHGMKVNGENTDKAEEEEVEEFDGFVEGLKVKLLPHQIDGYTWMRDKENGTKKTRGVLPKGGILADDMGLGKTIQSLALIMTNPKPSETEIKEMQESRDKTKRSLPAGLDKGTLVVAPLALIKQWEAEIGSKVEDSHALQVCVHHGPQRAKRSKDLKKYDVVITTYNTLTSEHAASDNKIKTGCYGLHWYRVILDEAHSIKNRTAKQTLAACALQSEYRWCLTGTPMQNNLDELQSLIKFLRIKPYDSLPAWREHITKPMNNGRGGLAIKRLQVYLKAFMKRRTKDILQKEGALQTSTAKTDEEDKPASFQIVKRTVERVETEFTPAERNFYDRLEQRADKSLKRMIAGDNLTYASALTLLLRLRQVCNHPKLAKNELREDKDALETLKWGAPTPRKKAVRNEEVDDLADMMGELGVNTKKCDFCQTELSAKEISAGSIRCAGCEADLDEDAITPRKKSGKSKKKNLHRKSVAKSNRQQRNRRIVTDSDDEEEENGEWLVPEDRRGNKKLGRAGGSDDENAEGGGIWLGSDDSIATPESSGFKKKVISLDTEDEEQSGNEDASESVEDEDEDDSTSDGSTSDEDPDTNSSRNLIISTKIRHLLRILKHDSHTHKYIVFSFFTSMLDLLEPFLRRGSSFPYRCYTRYDGSMRNDAREASLSRLRSDPTCRILLCSLKAGSLGLNLTAASRVVILEPFWNPFVEEQAIDRVHRLNQTRDVVVYKMTVRGTVEERILEMQDRKRELAEQAIEGHKHAGGKGAQKLSMREMLALFKMDAEHGPGPGLDGEARQMTERGGTGTGAGTGAGRERGSGAGAIERERESSEGLSDRRAKAPPSKNTATTTTGAPRRKEDAVFGRRW